MKYQHFQHAHGAFQKQEAPTTEPRVCIAILSTESNHTSPDNILVGMVCCDEL